MSCILCGGSNNLTEQTDGAVCRSCLPKYWELPPLWEHQEYAIDQLNVHEQLGEKRILIACPTGGGKTRIVQEVVKARPGKRFLFLTHRRLLLSQTSDVFWRSGMDHGMIAAGYRPASFRNAQIASVWSMHSKIKGGGWTPPAADYVIVDEAHAMMHSTAMSILQEHYRDAVKIGLTATPIGVGPYWTTMIQAGMTSDLQRYGSLVRATTYAPDEPDLKHIGLREYVFKQKDVTKVVMVPGIFGRVFDSMLRLNPMLAPTVMFTPSVKTGAWLCEQLSMRGIPAEMIHAKTPDDKRQELINRHRSGDLYVLGNRFTLREGVNFPWAEHIIFATVFGSLKDYLQAGGRGLRAHPGKTGVTIQDHGGNWWRWGSLNEDRLWCLDDTEQFIRQSRKKRLQDGVEHEPVRCPRCGAIRVGGQQCALCGHEHKMSVRMVVQHDGTLKPVRGKIFKPPKSAKLTPEEKQWRSLWYAGRNLGWTTRRARAVYRHKYGSWPPEGILPMPPVEQWFEPISSFGGEVWRPQPQEDMQ